MKSKKLISVLLSAIVVSSIALTGCGSSSNSTTADKDQHLNLEINVADVKTLDPSKGTDGYSAYVLQETMEAIARDEVKNGKEVVVPAGAKSWSQSSDGLTWTFKLRDNKWSDGKAVTADQYVYALRRSLDAKTASEYAYLLVNAGIKNGDAVNKGTMSPDQLGVSAPDSKTLVINLSHPCAYFEKLLNFKFFIPQRQDMVDKAGSKYGSAADTLVYNGPFKITSMVSGSKMELVKNDQYWDKKNVKLDKVTMNFMDDANTMLNALQSGQIDVADTSRPEWTNKLKSSGKFDQITGNVPANSYLNFNVQDKNKLLTNAKIRKAISLALNREDYLKTIGHSIGTVSYAWVPKAVQIGTDAYRDKASDVTLKNSKENPKELFKEGLKELGMDTDLSKVVLTDEEAGTDERHKQEGDYLINAFKKNLGVTLKVDYKEWKQFLQDEQDLNYEMQSGQMWSADYNDPMTFMDMWETDAAKTVNGYSSKEYDALIEDAKIQKDESKRLDDFKKAEDILINKDAAIAPTYSQGMSIFAYKYVKGLQTPVFAASGSRNVEFKYAYISGKK
ncbi:peptide ABC transporter substrate-binding protein [Clostridium felsineum]|uniref:Oligopeptide-binding protein OppA n=1 Tax=Clostridium felsineum TaxID=36839 RepID=A0A1S8LG55_9CLOT|nr:peptide ABC transporter substrate-binding protein [Clostridium felsineum]MCR3761820.1 peptide ABC transporter substrate-binding protein [Clostridium felsineum]URZ02905.1 Oligopeptide-binding protein OppA [Clostridium felsineum]URZ08757.1 Oligopeptide-binding protein OppA [Clostridium felsineum]URZ09385.1 Oligopeptide-binding protein OppA [Clostridium felsineum]URZ14258.1 Oligopeptide-binding protein OppA [Clostridium felsineum DSM 794]